jgi:hypothetical protein
MRAGTAGSAMIMWRKGTGKVPEKHWKIHDKHAFSVLNSTPYENQLTKLRHMF